MWNKDQKNRFFNGVLLCEPEAWDWDLDRRNKTSTYGASRVRMQERVKPIGKILYHCTIKLLVKATTCKTLTWTVCHKLKISKWDLHRRNRASAYKKMSLNINITEIFSIFWIFCTIKIFMQVRKWKIPQSKIYFYKCIAFQWNLDESNQTCSYGETFVWFSRKSSNSGICWKFRSEKEFTQWSKQIILQWKPPICFQSFDWDFDGENHTQCYGKKCPSVSQ